MNPRSRGNSPLLPVPLAFGLAFAELGGLGQARATDSTVALQEVVITANKRTSTVQDTPISVTAITGRDIEDRGVADFTALAQSVPGVSMRSSGPGQTEFEMRGVTSGGGNSATVGFYLDDVPLSAPAAAQNGKVVIDPNLYDLNRVEVLRGPQGTLYGAGSMGGTIKLIPNAPELGVFDTSGQSILSDTDGGGFNNGENAMLNIPLGDDVALRVVRMTLVGGVSVALAGLMLAYSFRRTGALYYACGFHAAWDGGSTFLFGVVAVGVRLPDTLFHAEMHGPVWLTGGSAGPIAGALGIIAFLMAIVGITRCRWRGTARSQVPTGRRAT